MPRIQLTDEQIAEGLRKSQERSAERYRAELRKEAVERYWQEQQERAVKEPPEEKKPVLTTL